MLNAFTQKIIACSLQNKKEELKEMLSDLEYHELTTLYVMCLNLSKAIRLAPNFGNRPQDS